ncbi:MAG: hypothetical protein M1376_05620 [Planctomycetes bacterium]|nr:hypothetical protein [Planctomycetota bacterium]
MRALGGIIWVVLLVVGGSANRAFGDLVNYLSNPSFETGDLMGWTVSGSNGGYGVLTDGASIPGAQAPFLPAYQNVRTGTYGAYAVTAGTEDEYVVFSQTLNLPAGPYTAGFYMGNDSARSVGTSYALEHGLLGIRVDGNLLSFNSSPPGNFPIGHSPADFLLLDADFVSAGGSTLIDFSISGSGTARAGISADDFGVFGESSSAVVPLPGAVLLGSVGLGVAGGWLRRRRTW